MGTVRNEWDPVNSVLSWIFLFFSLECWLNIYQNTRRHILEDSNFQVTRRCEVTLQSCLGWNTDVTRAIISESGLEWVTYQLTQKYERDAAQTLGEGWTNYAGLSRWTVLGDARTLVGRKDVSLFFFFFLLLWNVDPFPGNELNNFPRIRKWKM
jgi:hypothetical protein